MESVPTKKRKLSSSTVPDPETDLFDELPDDLVVDILSKLCTTASCPADFFSLLLTCKRMNKLGYHPTVLTKASPKVFTPKNWASIPNKFFISCLHVFNMEAIYTIAMIKFYCFQDTNSRETGKALLAMAAANAHPGALYSASLMHFNGSGGLKRNLPHAFKVAARAAVLGHIDAIRELGYCLQEGYGAAKDTAEGWRLIQQAMAQKVALMMPPPRGGTPYTDDPPGSGPDIIPVPVPTRPELASGRWVKWLPKSVTEVVFPLTGRVLGRVVPPPEPHPVHRFLTEWFATRGVPGEGRRLCSNKECGRPETRVREFVRCPVCNAVSYCSRVCRRTDWRRRHRDECTPTVNGNNAGGAAAVGVQEEQVEVAGGGEIQE